MAVDNTTARRVQIYAVLLIAASLGVMFVAWRWLGAIGIVLSAPLLGLALARPVLGLLAALQQLAAERALRDVQGRYFMHHGHPIDIADDDVGYRWLRTDDVRKIVTGLPADAVLLRLFPEGVAQWSPADGYRMRAEALHKYLQKASDPASIRFRNWVETEVVMPADKRRAR